MYRMKVYTNEFYDRRPPSEFTGKKIYTFTGEFILVKTKVFV